MVPNIPSYSLSCSTKRIKSRYLKKINLDLCRKQKCIDKFMRSNEKQNRYKERLIKLIGIIKHEVGKKTEDKINTNIIMVDAEEVKNNLKCNLGEINEFKKKKKLLKVKDLRKKSILKKILKNNLQKNLEKNLEKNLKINLENIPKFNLKFNLKNKLENNLKNKIEHSKCNCKPKIGYELKNIKNPPKLNHQYTLFILEKSLLLHLKHLTQTELKTTNLIDYLIAKIKERKLKIKQLIKIELQNKKKYNLELKEIKVNEFGQSKNNRRKNIRQDNKSRSSRNKISQSEISCVIDQSEMENNQSKNIINQLKDFKKKNFSIKLKILKNTDTNSIKKTLYNPNSINQLKILKNTDTNSIKKTLYKSNSINQVKFRIKLPITKAFNSIQPIKTPFKIKTPIYKSANHFTYLNKSNSQFMHTMKHERLAEELADDDNKYINSHQLIDKDAPDINEYLLDSAVDNNTNLEVEITKVHKKSTQEPEQSKLQFKEQKNNSLNSEEHIQLNSEEVCCEIKSCDVEDLEKCKIKEERPINTFTALELINQSKIEELESVNNEGLINQFINLENAEQVNIETNKKFKKDFYRPTNNSLYSGEISNNESELREIDQSNCNLELPYFELNECKKPSAKSKIILENKGNEPGNCNITDNYNITTSNNTIVLPDFEDICKPQESFVSSCSSTAIDINSLQPTNVINNNYNSSKLNIPGNYVKERFDTQIADNLAMIRQHLSQVNSYKVYADLSPIHGIGLFARHLIKAGSKIIEYVGEIIGINMADKRELEYQKNNIYSTYLFKVKEDIIIDATLKGNLARFINHSCVPNSKSRIENDRVFICAVCEIKEGEEITFYYNFTKDEAEDKVECNCGHPECAKYIV